MGLLSALHIDSAIGHINPAATGAASGEERFGQAASALGLTLGSVDTHWGRAKPEHFRSLDRSIPTAAIVHGGDSTANGVVSAMLGVVRDDYAATKANLAEQAERISNTLLVLLAGGYACNAANSALGPYATKPKLLETATDVQVGRLRPLGYRVLSAAGVVTDCGVVTSCIGLQMTPNIARALEVQKPNLCGLKPPHRLAREGITMLDEMWHAEQFSLKTTITQDGKAQERLLSDLTAFELVGTNRYAQFGKTPARINDTNQQLILERYRRNPALRAFGIIGALGRLITGRHREKPLDFAGIKLAIQLESEHPIPFHVDGGIDRRFVLHHGETLELELLPDVAIPVLIRDV